MSKIIRWTNKNAVMVINRHKYICSLMASLKIDFDFNSMATHKFNAMILFVHVQTMSNYRVDIFFNH